MNKKKVITVIVIVAVFGIAGYLYQKNKQEKERQKAMSDAEYAKAKAEADALAAKSESEKRQTYTQDALKFSDWRQKSDDHPNISGYQKLNNTISSGVMSTDELKLLHDGYLISQNKYVGTERESVILKTQIPAILKKYQIQTQAATGHMYDLTTGTTTLSTGNDSINFHGHVM